MRVESLEAQGHYVFRPGQFGFGGGTMMFGSRTNDMIPGPTPSLLYPQVIEFYPSLSQVGWLLGVGCGQAHCTFASTQSGSAHSHISDQPLLTNSSTGANTTQLTTSPNQPPPPTT